MSFTTSTVVNVTFAILTSHQSRPSSPVLASFFSIEACLRLIEHEEKPVQGLTEEEDMLPSEIEGLVQSAQLLFLTSL